MCQQLYELTRQLGHLTGRAAAMPAVLTAADTRYKSDLHHQTSKVTHAWDPKHEASAIP